MKKRLSKNSITSFCGDVIPLWFVCGENEKQEDIEWKVVGDSVRITDLSDNTEYSVKNGVLLTLASVGESYILQNNE